MPCVSLVTELYLQSRTQALCVPHTPPAHPLSQLVSCCAKVFEISDGALGAAKRNASPLFVNHFITAVKDVETSVKVEGKELKTDFSVKSPRRAREGWGGGH